MQLKAGRNFYSIPQADSNHIIINETLSKLMGAQGKPGGIMESNGHRYQVIGIVNDFVYNDVYSQSEPVMFFCDPANTHVITIRYKQHASVTAAIDQTEAILKAQDPVNPFDFKFVDQDFNHLFKTEMLTGKLAGIFSALPILISCIGLFGLATYTAEQRTKEIGILKVLGAGIAGIITLFSKDFLRLVLISCFIAFPIAWWVTNNWLQNFAYRIAISWWVFIGAGMAALLIALLTISFQAVRSALGNPVKALRSE